MAAAFDDMRIDLGIGAVSAAIRTANRYLEKKQPWTLASQGNTAELNTVLYAAAEALRIVSGLLYPIMPSKMAELRSALGIVEEQPCLADLRVWGKLLPGTALGKAISLFPRIDPAARERQGDAPVTAAVKTVPAAVPGVMLIDYAEFEKVHLRTAKIILAEKIAGADKLLRLEIEVGAEHRQIVAGIAQHYRPEDLPGKTIIVVANLKPAKIRGVESNGMLLAASAPDKTLRIITVDGGIDSGCVVK